MERVHTAPITQENASGIALNLVFKYPLRQTPQISPKQIITLQNIAPLSPKAEHFNTSILKSLEIYSQNNTLFIVPKSNLLFDVRAKLSQDKTYLRLEFLPLLNMPSSPAKEVESPSQRVPILKKEEDLLPWDHVWKIALVLGILLVVLWFLKRKNTQQFLFPKVGLEPSVTFVKPLDATHKLVTIEVRNQLYLILLNSNQSVVLDKINLDFSLKKDSGRLKEELMEETKERLRQSKLKDSYV
ncbi:hypothetical protein ACFOPX_04605 [Helicobacter baculiformis]|uniref:Flagellar protein n=1 Tax=Helicobacter baculiformis TaxID=427351 RepID=A0ABV7ZKW6_9HELI|nr:hypothetical protein [Helicobacter baculiformis]